MAENENENEAKSTEAQGEEEIAPYVIEAARSSRSKCKTCRRKIDKGSTRIGIRVEGFYGPGYMWHHLGCAARRQMDKVEEAYELEAWNEAKEPPQKLPSLDELRAQQEKAEEKRRQRKEIPYAEVDPSGRAKCKQCGEPLEKGSLRVVLGREVVFGRQTRTTPIQVHPKCVPAALAAPDVINERESLEEDLRVNSELESEQVDAIMAEVGAAETEG